MVTNDYTSEIGLKEFFPIGWFGTGDFVCAHPSGTLFVVLSDTFEWCDSDVALDELLRRSEAADEALEEDVYSRNPPSFIDSP